MALIQTPQTLSPQSEAQAPHDPQTPEQQQSGTGVGASSEQMGMIHGPGIESTRFNNYLHGSKCLIRTEDEMNRKGKLTCERGRGGSHNQRAWFNTSMARIMNDMKISRGEKQSASQETRTSLVWPVQDFRMLSMISMLYSLASCLTMRERLSE
ncbi:hypothetical protein ACJX0J_032227, partial [Zea mays]